MATNTTRSYKRVMIAQSRSPESNRTKLAKLWLFGRLKINYQNGRHGGQISDRKDSSWFLTTRCHEAQHQDSWKWAASEEILFKEIVDLCTHSWTTALHIYINLKLLLKSANNTAQESNQISTRHNFNPIILSNSSNEWSAQHNCIAPGFSKRCTQSATRDFQIFTKLIYVLLQNSQYDDMMTIQIGSMQMKFRFR